MSSNPSENVKMGWSRGLWPRRNRWEKSTLVSASLASAHSLPRAASLRLSGAQNWIDTRWEKKGKSAEEGKRVGETKRGGASEKTVLLIWSILISERSGFGKIKF